MSNHNTKEEWRAIPGFEELYEVSNIGRVRSLDKDVPGWRFHRGKVLRPGPDSAGYPTIVINDSVGGYRRTWRVHVLVAMAFITDGPIPDGMHVCHNDGTRDNNRLENLRVDTPSGNSGDKREHGTHMFGSKSPVSKITESDVVEIRRRLGAGESSDKIARDYPITGGTIRNIRRNEIWTHVE